LGFSPHDHLRGVLGLLDRMRGLTGTRSELDALRALIDRPAALPAGAEQADVGLKDDVYWSMGPSGPRWGVTINDRYERAGFQHELARFVQAIGGDYRLDALSVARAALPGTRPALTFAVGFDAESAPPRLKLYLQEDRWGEQVSSAAAVRALAERLVPGVQWPSWLDPERPIGVVALELHAKGAVGLKLYLGAASADEAAGAAPPRVRTLARVLGEASPLAPAYHYLTVRLGAAPPRYAINKIYDAVRLADPSSRSALREAWADVAGLFSAAGREQAFAQLAPLIKSSPALRVAPTASALEGRADSVDVYFSAFGA
jgi:hypothetical protein